MKYYFWVEETDAHDEELEIITARSLKKAREEFAGMHPEDVEHIEHIDKENQFAPVWQKGDL